MVCIWRFVFFITSSPFLLSISPIQTHMPTYTTTFYSLDSPHSRSRIQSPNVVFLRFLFFTQICWAYTNWTKILSVHGKTRWIMSMLEAQEVPYFTKTMFQNIQSDSIRLCIPYIFADLFLIKDFLFWNLLSADQHYDASMLSNRKKISNLEILLKLCTEYNDWIHVHDMIHSSIYLDIVALCAI